MMDVHQNLISSCQKRLLQCAPGVGRTQDIFTGSRRLALYHWVEDRQLPATTTWPEQDMQPQSLPARLALVPHPKAGGRTPWCVDVSAAHPQEAPGGWGRPSERGLRPTRPGPSSRSLPPALPRSAHLSLHSYNPDLPRQKWRGVVTTPRASGPLRRNRQLPSLARAAAQPVADSLCS